MPIETPEEFREWLEEQPHETCLLIAVRAALRVFPIAIHKYEVGPENERVALLIARALLTAGVASLFNSRGISRAAKAAENAADQGADASHEAGMATIYAVTAVSVSSRTAFAKSAAEYSADAVESDLGAGDSVIRTKAAEETRSAAYLDAENPFPTLLEVPIWHGPKEPDWLRTHLASTTRLLESGLSWSFWREWYQGFLDGKPMDWELQRRVALIDDAIWEAGPEAVAEEIERIRTAFDVEKLASDLTEKAANSTKAKRGIGGNNPPSPVEDALKSLDGVTVIWAAAQTLKEEAQAEKPGKGRVRKAIGALLSAMKACGIWSAKKADKAVTAAVIAMGGFGGKEAVAWVTQNGDKVWELIEAAQKWLHFLS